MTDDGTRQGTGWEPMTWLDGRMVSRREADRILKAETAATPASVPGETAAVTQAQPPTAQDRGGPRPDTPPAGKAEQTSIPTIPEQLHGCRFVKVRRRGKVALETGWQTTANYDDDDPRILSHLKNGGNYGVMPAGGVCVLDADKAGRLRDLGILDIFNGAYTVRTGRETGDGLHIYFRCTGAPAEKFILRDPLTGDELGDLRGSGHPSYCVGPGSVHPSGLKYVPVDETAAVIEIPWETLRDRVIKPLTPQEPEVSREPSTPADHQRQPGGAKAAGTLVDKLELRVTDFLYPINSRRRDDEIEGEHPIHGSETGSNLTINETKNVWWCRRHMTGGGPFEALAVAEGIIDCADARPGCLDGRLKEVFDALRRRGYGDRLDEALTQHKRDVIATRVEEREEGLDPNAFYYIDGKGRVNLVYSEVARYLCERFHTVTFNKTLYLYDAETGLYTENTGKAEAAIQEIAELVGFAGEITKAKREVMSYVTHQNVVSEYPFNRYNNAIPVANGVLVMDWELETATLRDYGPEYMFTYKWPVIYDPQASPDPIHGVFGSYVEDEEIDVLYQIPAQAILHACGFGPFKKSYILEGPTNSGKTTYVVEWLNRLFGEENIAGISLQQIGTDRFVGSALTGKALNRYDDLSDVPLENIGPFKALTGTFSHSIEVKFHTPYSGRITAVHVFSTNTPPKVPDQVSYDTAFWSRWVYLKFNNVFEVDPSFTNREFTPGHMSGSFNRVLEYVFRMRRTNAVVYDQDPGEVRYAWYAASNPFLQFVNAEMHRVAGRAQFEKSHLYRAFIDWCNNNGIGPRKVPGTITGFTQMIYPAGFVTKRLSRRRGGEWVYEGAYEWNYNSKYREFI